MHHADARADDGEQEQEQRRGGRALRRAREARRLLAGREALERSRRVACESQLQPGLVRRGRRDRRAGSARGVRRAPLVDALDHGGPEAGVCSGDGVRQPVAPLLDRRLHSAHHVLPEERGGVLAVEQRKRARQAQLAVEERVAARLHLEQRLLGLGHPHAQVARRLLQVLRDLALDLLERGLVLGERRQPGFRPARRDLDRAVGDAQRALELDAQAAHVVERAREVRLERSEAVARRVGQVAGCLRLPRLARRDSEHLGAQAEQLAQLVAHELDHLLDVGRILQDVDLVDRDHHLLAPVADRLEELPLALRERPIGGGHEEHELRARHEVARQGLVTLDDGVRAGRVDDVHLAQELERQRDLLEVAAGGRALALGAVLDELDPRGGGGGPLLEHLLAEQGVDHRALARVELADHHQQEQLVELADGARERLLVLLRGPDAHEQHPQLCELSVQLPEQALALLVEDAL